MYTVLYYPSCLLCKVVKLLRDLYDLDDLDDISILKWLQIGTFISAMYHMVLVTG